MDTMFNKREFARRGGVILEPSEEERASRWAVRLEGAGTGAAGPVSGSWGRASGRIWGFFRGIS